jgi:hypothetical protein
MAFSGVSKISGICVWCIDWRLSIFSLFLMMRCISFLHHCQGPGDHNKRTVLSKETKATVKRAFGRYDTKFIHEISLVSTLPFVAQDSEDKQRKLDFMDVISNLSLTFGNSSDYGYNRNCDELSKSSQRAPRELPARTASQRAPISKS